MAIDEVGGQRRLAREINKFIVDGRTPISQAHIFNWLHKTKNGPPASICHIISNVSGVPLWVLRPDVWDLPMWVKKIK